MKSEKSLLNTGEHSEHEGKVERGDQKGIAGFKRRRKMTTVTLNKIVKPTQGLLNNNVTSHFTLLCST